MGASIPVRGMWIIMSIAFSSMPLSGCSRVEQDHQDHQEKRFTQLSFCEARQAIVNMIKESKSELLQPLIAELTRIDPSQLEDYSTLKYHVRVALSHQRFTIVYRIRRRRFVFSGEFICTPPGQWRAFITVEEEIWK